MDQAAILDHQFRVAAYILTWCIQLGYLGFLAARWRSLKREADRRERSLR
jgi:hypothetical protein